MATMDPGQRGFGRPMRRQGPVDRFDEAVGEDRSVDRKRLLALLMSILSDARWVADSHVSARQWADHRWVADSHPWSEWKTSSAL